ncbi:MAG: 2-amino-4-hydroxy-6-hydroxymethyldihydropteridine diphosphokinase [Verrucomicrobia bacterium]|nr:2-amino-4-hydroxy-6-hydroxymethyldihydropteridine diphosphokinase [Verrucomicrobiota bacterium]
MEFGLSLGSNLGDRLEHLRRARGRIATLDGVVEVAASGVDATEPVDVSDAYRDFPFLNAVLIVASERHVEELARVLHAIEHDFGRIRQADKNAPRPLDIDIIYAGDLTVATPSLTLPHARWNERRFVVQPLADVRADLKLPGCDQAVGALLLALPTSPDVIVFARTWEAIHGVVDR